MPAKEAFVVESAKGDIGQSTVVAPTFAANMPKERSRRL
jgi:hypothetical protein